MNRYSAPPAWKPGDYAVVRTGGFVGQMIRLLTRSRHNHAFIIVDEAGTTVEAFPSGAALGNVSKYRRLTVSRLDLPDASRAAVVQEALGLVGRGYGFLDILCLALLQFGIRPRLVRRRVARSGRLICSQLVDVAYLYAGVHLFNDGRQSQDVTPGDLAELLLDPSAVTVSDPLPAPPI